MKYPSCLLHKHGSKRVTPNFALVTTICIGCKSSYHLIVVGSSDSALNTTEAKPAELATTLLCPVVVPRVHFGVYAKPFTVVASDFSTAPPPSVTVNSTRMPDTGLSNWSRT